MKLKESCYLVGNPNSGKSSLFHKLTGLYQKVANYPGVTTEKKEGVIQLKHKDIYITDLPGCYSLYPNSIDERVVLRELLIHPSQYVIFVADASNLSRSILLLTQVSDMGYPVILVINMIDELKRKGEKIHIDIIKKNLNIPVFPCNSRTGEGIDAFKTYLDTHEILQVHSEFGNNKLFTQYFGSETISYKQWLEYVMDTEHNAIVENTKRRDIIFRYNLIDQLSKNFLTPTQEAIRKIHFSDRIDKYLLHPIYGTILLIILSYFVFQLLFTFAAYPMEWLDNLFSWTQEWVNTLSITGYIKSFISNAVIPGIAGILIFIPQIVLLFVLNTILEESGYMSRIVFICDRWMRKFGMSGKSILPLISGNACAIPAISSTKTIATHRERLITMLTIPFMTCSARLPVYTLIISLIFSLKYQGLVLMGLYLLGALSAIILGFILKKVIKTQEESMLIMEVPPLRLPSFQNIVVNVKHAVFPFVKTAGKYIFTVSIILWFLGSYHIQRNLEIKPTDIEHSSLANIGQFITPVIKPLGYDWKIGVSLLSSFMAREVFVSTLATLYHINSDSPEAILSNIKNAKDPITHQNTFTPAVGISLLFFYAFALQCMSTIAVLKKETGSWLYPLVLFFVMLILAYSFSFAAYQILK